MHFSNYLHKLRFNQENKVILNIPGIKKSIHEFGLISGLEYLGEWDQASRLQNGKNKNKKTIKEGHYQRAGKHALNPSAHHHSVGGYQKHYRNFSSLQEPMSNLSATVSVCITKASWFSITPWKATVSLLPAQHPAAITPEHNRFYSFHPKKKLMLLPLANSNSGPYREGDWKGCHAHLASQRCRRDLRRGGSDTYCTWSWLSHHIPALCQCGIHTVSLYPFLTSK